MLLVDEHNECMSRHNMPAAGLQTCTFCNQAGQGRAGQGRAEHNRTGRKQEQVQESRGNATTAPRLQRPGFHSKCVPVCRYLGVASGFVHDQVEGLQHAKGRQLLLHLHAHATCLLADSAQHSTAGSSVISTLLCSRWMSTSLLVETAGDDQHSRQSRQS